VKDSILLLCVFLVGASVLVAQTYKGTISGSVTDPSGAAVPGATLLLTNTATAEVRTTVSEADGRYAFAQLNPSVYSLQVTKTGFRDYVATEIQLNASQAREVNVSLVVGQARQTVEVTAGVGLMDTQTANQSVTLNNVLVEELPAQARDPLVLFEFQAGAVAPRTGVSTSDSDENQNRFEINGAGDEQVLVLIDGVPDATGDWGGAISVPSVDSVQQFQVIRNAYDARYSRTRGGVVNIVTKGGTEHFHGTGFEYLQNSSLNANSFFNNKNHVAKTPYRRNFFGGNFGGPILKKYRLFGFFGVEALREAAPGSITATMPTALERQGNFSNSYNADGTQILIYDPASSVLNPATGSYTRTAFPGDQVPASEISPIAKNVLGLLPSPNVPGTGHALTNNYYAIANTIEKNERYDGRVDYVVSNKDSLFGRFTKEPESSVPQSPYSVLVNGNRSSLEPRWGFAFGNTFTLNATTVITISLGGGKFTELNNVLAYGANLAPLGLPSNLLADFNVPVPPSFIMTNYYSPGYPGSGNDSVSNAERSMVNYGVFGSKQRGAHLVTFGWYENRYMLAQVETNAANFTFNRYFTDGPTAALSGNVDSGSDIASFLLGDAISGDLPVASQPYTTQTDWNFFVQDAWKVTPRLTVNVGLAYELQRGRTERFDRVNYFDFTDPSPLAQAAGLPNLKGGLAFVNSKQPFEWDPSDLSFAPRFGLAYRIGNNLVYRGGYGIFYTPSVAVGPEGTTGYSDDNSMVSTLNNGITPDNTLNNPFPNGIVNPTGSSLGLATAVGQVITTFQRSTPTPYLQQFSSELQYQVNKGLLVEGGYTGSQGRRLIYCYNGYYVGSNINQVPDSDLALGNALNNPVANPFYGVITSGPLSTPRVLQSQLLRPYPQFENIYILNHNGATSSFNALVLRATERLTSGLTLLASYQRSRAMDNASEDQGWEVSDAFRDWYNLAAEKSVSAHDIPNSFSASWIYHLPVGKGQHYGAKLNPVLNGVIGGWQTSGTYQLLSGLPLHFTAAANEFNYADSQFPNINSGVSQTVSKPTLTEWFNTAAFSQPANFTYGNAPRFDGQIRYSHTNNWNLSIEKNFPMRENINWQFRAEMYNAFNWVQFGRANTSVTSSSFGQVTGTGPEQVHG
jgi:hypothetical protein